MPKVSIIIPIYNAEKTLKRCLDSILNQTFTDWEAICVNDGSTDKTQYILKEYASLDSRFKIIYQTNSGSATARQTGIEHATGEYIAWVDADDYIDKTLYENALLNNNDADIITFGYKRIENDHISIINDLHNVTSRHELFAKHFNSRFHSLCVLISKQQLWIKHNIHFNPGQNFCEDLNVTTKLLAVAQNIQHLNIDSYYYYVDNSSSQCNTLTIDHIKQRRNNIIDLHTFLIKIPDYYSTILPSFAQIMLSAKQPISAKSWRKYVELAPEVNKYIYNNKNIPIHKKLYLLFIVLTYPLWKHF